MPLILEKQNNNEIPKQRRNIMVSAIVIPIIIVSILGLVGYLVYRTVVYDFLCKRSVDQMLQKYRISKSSSEIITEYHKTKGEEISEKEIKKLEKHYRQNEPEQFLAMYDVIRKNLED